MADFIGTLKAMPQMSGMTNAVEGLVDDAILDLYGKHRWPFLKETDRELSWAASDSKQAFDGIARITSVRYPDSSSQKRPLELLSDDRFAEYKYQNYNMTEIRVWRDAGLAGDKTNIELFAVPGAAVTLECDCYPIPTVADIDLLPGYFRRLVRLMVLSEAPDGRVSVVNIDYAVREAIAREEDMAGEVNYIGPDDHIQGMMRDVNNPS